MSDKAQRKVTHSAGVDWIGKDGIKRSFNIVKENDGTVRMQLTTWWDGEDAEPMVTNIGLGQETFDYFTDGIIAFRMRLSDFEIKDAAEDKQ